MSKVSVIIPNYNRSKVIRDTIDAVLNQTLKPHEVIVVDDGSTDNSIEVLKTYGSKIKIIQQANQGPAAARNKGFLNSTGDFISFMDSDDIPSLNKLQVQADALISENADMVIGPWVRGWFNGSTFKPEEVVLQAEKVPVSKSILHWFLTDWSMVFQQTIVKRSIISKAGLYNEKMKMMEDGDLFVRLLLADAKVVFENITLTLYRLGNQDKLTNMGASQSKKTGDHYYFYKNLFENAPFLDIYKDYKFQIKIMNLMNELKESSSNSVQLKKYVSYPLWLLKLLSLKQRISKGLQQRIKGHRWSESFQTKPLNDKQISLINSLGYSIAS